MDYMWTFIEDEEPPEGCAQIEVMLLDGNPNNNVSEVWCSCDYWWAKNSGRNFVWCWRPMMENTND